MALSPEAGDERAQRIRTQEGHEGAGDCPNAGVFEAFARIRRGARERMEVVARRARCSATSAGREGDWEVKLFPNQLFRGWLSLVLSLAAAVSLAVQASAGPYRIDLRTDPTV